MSKPRILLAYPYFPSQTYSDVEQLQLAQIERLNSCGHWVEGFCITVNPPAPMIKFRELDALWKRGDRDLMVMYDRLEKKLDDGKFDVLINECGINLHPSFVERLPVFTVFQCFDDPESSRHLSRPAAAAYDLSFVGNIAELDTYRSWGVRHVHWTPMGIQHGVYDPTLTEQEILDGQRSIDLFMMSDRLSRVRKPRLDQLAAAFPDAHFYGQGWARGYLDWDDQIDSLRQAKIGPNLHNSTGPINYRTFYIPANGVLLICDNKRHLGGIYELNKEAVGFDTVDECIELCRYYLAHDRERREIAAAGWKRAMNDYTEEAVFNRKVRIINEQINSRELRTTETGIANRQTQATQTRRRFHAAHAPITQPLRKAVRSAKQPLRHLKTTLRNWRSAHGTTNAPDRVP